MARGGWWGFHIELSFPEVAAVVAGAVGSAFVIFLLGVWVGKGWEARRLTEEQQLIRMPVGDKAATAGSKDEGRLQFYERLTAPKRSPAGSVGQAGRGTPAAAKGVKRKSRASVAVGVQAAKVDQARKGKWSVQVLASKDENSAGRLLTELQKAGFKAYIVKLRKDGELRYRVRVGPFPSLDSARDAAAQLRHRRGITETFVASE